MAALRIKRKLGTEARETQEYPRNNQSEKSAAPGITEEYIAQVSEEIEGKGTIKNVSGIQQDIVPHPECSVQVRRISLEPADTDLLRNRSRSIPER